MPLIELSNVIANSGSIPLRNAGPPANPTSEVDSLASTATGGTFTLTVQVGNTPAQTTTALQFNDTAANVQAALRALTNIGSAGVTCTGGALGTAAVVCTFADIAANAVVTMTPNTASLTGGTVTNTQTTVGTPGTFASKVIKGGLVEDTTTGILYANTGTAAAPTWTKVGTQT